MLYLLLPAYIRIYITYLYEQNGAVEFPPTTVAFRLLRDALTDNHRRRALSPIAFSQRAVDEVRRHKNHRAINSTPDLPDYEQLSELTPIRITPDYARTPSDTLTLSRRGATTLVRELTNQFWRNLIDTTDRTTRIQVAENTFDGRRPIIEQWLLTYGIEPADYLDTIYRQYQRQLDYRNRHTKANAYRISQPHPHDRHLPTCDLHATKPRTQFRFLDNQGNTVFICRSTNQNAARMQYYRWRKRNSR